MATVSELREGQEFEGGLWLVSGSTRQTRKGDPYWEGVLQDATGSLPAKLWDSAGGRSGLVRAFADVLRPGTALRVRARVDAYQGQLQLTLQDAESWPDAPAALFSPRSRRPLDEMLAEVESIERSLEDPDYRRLLAAFRKDGARFGAFSEAPAAKAIHHAWVHGLLEHSLQLAKLARAVGPHYPGVDLEMVLLGCFFHDAGKAEEISSRPGFEYTTPGKLLGHIYMGARLVEGLCDSLAGFPEEKRLQLVHLVLSHQGERAEGFGSAADPSTPEAILFHHLDNLDAKVQHCLTTLQRAEESGEEGAFAVGRLPLRKGYYRTRPRGEEAKERPPRPAPSQIPRDEEENGAPQPKLW